MVIFSFLCTWIIEADFLRNFSQNNDEGENYTKAKWHESRHSRWEEKKIRW